MELFCEIVIEFALEIITQPQRGEIQEMFNVSCSIRFLYIEWSTENTTVRAVEMHMYKNMLQSCQFSCETRKNWFLSSDMCSLLSRDIKTQTPRRSGLNFCHVFNAVYIELCVLTPLACLLCSRLLSLIVVLHTGNRNPRKIHFST